MNISFALMLLVLTASRLSAQPAEWMVRADKSGSLLTCSLQEGAASYGGSTQTLTGQGWYRHSPRIERVVIRGIIADFGTGHPADDAVQLRKLQGLTYPDLVTTGDLLDEPGGQVLAGTVLFGGVIYPFRQPADVTIRGGQQIIECVILVGPIGVPTRINWPGRAKRRLRVGFMVSFPVPPAGQLTLN